MTIPVHIVAIVAVLAFMVNLLSSIWRRSGIREQIECLHLGVEQVQKMADALPDSPIKQGAITHVRSARTTHDEVLASYQDKRRHSSAWRKSAAVSLHTAALEVSKARRILEDLLPGQE